LEAEELCDRIALLSKGKIIAVGSPRELKKLIAEREVVRVVTKDVLKALVALKRARGVVAARAGAGFVDATVLDRRGVASVLECVSSKKIVATAVQLLEPPLEEVFSKLVFGRKQVASGGKMTEGGGVESGRQAADRQFSGGRESWGEGN